VVPLGTGTSAGDVSPRLVAPPVPSPHAVLFDVLGTRTTTVVEVGSVSVLLPIVGLAKSRTQSDFASSDVIATEERFFLPGRSNPIIFKPNSEAFQILVGLRDEAHRFAITYHRKLRESSSLESELDLIVGLGEKRKKELLTHFSSVESIKEATVEQIARLKGFHRVLAERVLLQLSETFDNSNASEDSES
jgi:excinuclease ABC subunit C